MFDRNLSHELADVSEQARATAVALTAIGIEIQAVVQEERHDPALAAVVLDAHAKRAALAVTTIAAYVGKLALLARMGAGLVLLALCLAGCCGSVESEPADDCAAFKACAADKTATVVCADGSCSCVGSHPGENRVVSCRSEQ